MYIGEESDIKTMLGLKGQLNENTLEILGTLPLSTLMKNLHSEKIPRGHSALMSVKAWLETRCSTPEETSVILSVLQKNPRLGVSWHSFTKVSGVTKYEVKLAVDINKVKNLDKKMTWPVYVQPKLDGYRGTASTDDEGEFELKSRNGKVYENFPKIVEALEEIGYVDDVLDGELMSDDFQSMQKSAFASKRGTVVGDVKFYIFDHLEDTEFSRKKCLRNFSSRLKDLEHYKDKHPLIKVVETIKCNDWQEIATAHARFREEGYEGSIVILDRPYQFKRSDDLLKIKDMLSQDCKILDVIEGKGKLVGTMGAIQVLQQNGKTICEVGTGFTDEMREAFWDQRKELKDNIVEIKYQELTPDGVMRFPVFQRFRDDKLNIKPKKKKTP